MRCRTETERSVPVQRLEISTEIFLAGRRKSTRGSEVSSIYHQHRGCVFSFFFRCEQKHKFKRMIIDTAVSGRAHRTPAAEQRSQDLDRRWRVWILRTAQRALSIGPAVPSHETSSDNARAPADSLYAVHENACSGVP